MGKDAEVKTTTLERDESEVAIPLERWDRFSKDTKDMWQMYSCRNPRIDSAFIYIVVSTYRLDELLSEAQ